MVFLLAGGAWGSYTVFTAGPWPLMLISAATMLGPGFMRLWISGATPGSPSLPGPEPGERQSFSLPGSSNAASETEAGP